MGNGVLQRVDDGANILPASDPAKPNPSRTMEYAIAVVVAVVAGAVGLLVGRSSGHAAGLEEGRSAGREEGRSGGLAAGRKEAEGRLRGIIDAVERGREPAGLKPGTPEAELQAALRRGWTPREAEREAALREAVGRVSGFLDRSVRAHLSGLGENATPDELRAGVERALGSLQDLDFFLSEATLTTEGTNLVSLAQGVSREFANDQGIAVRMMLEKSTVRAVVSAVALMDALYLVLHNAARFGGGSTIDLTVAESGGRARIVVRDRGRGFSEEAFARAFDPFYSTTPDGLGLGLPHARKLVEEMGGRIELRNVPDGGAEVELSFPTG